MFKINVSEFSTEVKFLKHRRRYALAKVSVYASEENTLLSVLSSINKVPLRVSISPTFTPFLSR